MNPIVMRIDNRYKNGNIKKVDGVLRGNAKTLAITRIDTTGDPIYYRPNPPIVVSPELAAAIKENL